MTTKADQTDDRTLERSFAELTRVTIPYGRQGGYYVYALVDPRTDLPFYIGKGSGRRADQHFANWRNAKEPNGAKALVFGELADDGLMPRILVIADQMDESAAYDRERALIYEYRKILTNAVRGQRSAKQRSMDRGAQMLQRLKSFEAWCAERPRSDADKSLFHRIVAELRKVASEGAPISVLLPPGQEPVYGY